MVHFLRLFASVLLFALTSTVVAQETGRIQGRVTDADRSLEALPFAKVSLAGSKTSVRTNLHGNFEFPALPSGEYVVTIAFLGYEETSFPVEVHQGETVWVTGAIKPLVPEPPASKTR